MPIHPRGPRRKQPPGPRRELLACPRVSPEWELDAFRALIKPQARGPILHRRAGQTWSASAQQTVHTVAEEIERCLGFRAELHFPPRGDYFFVADVPETRIDAARALAVVLSKCLPERWFVIGRLFVLNGHFFRRARGYKLDLVPASSVHLPRSIRAAIAGAERCPDSRLSQSLSQPSGRAR